MMDSRSRSPIRVVPRLTRGWLCAAALLTCAFPGEANSSLCRGEQVADVVKQGNIVCSRIETESGHVVFAYLSISVFEVLAIDSKRPSIDIDRQANGNSPVTQACCLPDSQRQPSTATK